MLPNDNVSMSVGHLDHVLIVYSSTEHVTWKSPGPMWDQVTEEGNRKKEEHVAKALSKCGYPPWTIDRVKQDIVEKSLKDEAKKSKEHKRQSQRYGCSAICERTE